MAIPAVSRPQRVGLTRQCVQSIKEYIAYNNVKPGDKLPSQQEWADLLGVSVLAVREAFQALQSTGLVDVQHGRGIFLRGPEDTDFITFLELTHSGDEHSLNEITEARAMLELAVLEGCIAQATPEDMAELEQLIQSMREDSSPAAGEPAAHREFHRVMLRACGNQLLMNIGMPLLNTFWVLSRRLGPGRSIVLSNASLADTHTGYLDAIKKRDKSRTRELVDDHLSGMCSRNRIFPFR
jgi:GntR family transcriptional repressor for pyruvate dehydrogenase complex